MNEATNSDTRVFGPSKNLLVVIGCFLAFFLVMGISVGIKNGDWKGLAIAGLPGGLLLVALAVRLEIGPNGVGHRTLLGWRALEFDSIVRATFEAVGRRGRGAASMLMESHDGRELRIFLRRYPIEAAVALIEALQFRGVEVEIADGRAAYWAEQVAAAQAAAKR